MAIITNATVRTVRGRRRLLADPHGNNIAVVCPKCGKHPVLLIARRNQRGSDAQHPGRCRGCQAGVWMTSPVAAGIPVNTVSIAYR